jgi:hypothetical protein
MPSDLTNSLKAVAEKVSDFVSKAAELKVETYYVEVGGAAAVVNFDAASPAASTLIQLDGDCKSVIPVRRNQAGELEVDSDLFALHERNVATAIDYRTRMMDALLQTLKETITR